MDNLIEGNYMKISNFKSDIFYWSEQNVYQFEDEHQTEHFMKNLKQYINTSGKVIQINEEEMKWREITGKSIAPLWNKLEE